MVDCQKCPGGRVTRVPLVETARVRIFGISGFVDGYGLGLDSLRF